MMYFSNITNVELLKFHGMNKVNANGVEVDESVFKTNADKSKIVPLFYFDTIATENDLITSLEDKVVLNKLDNSLSNVLPFVQFKSDNGAVVEWSVIYKFHNYHDRWFLSLHFYNKYSAFSINELSFNLTHTEDDTVYLNKDFITNNRGNIVVEVTGDSGVFTITDIDGNTYTFTEA